MNGAIIPFPNAGPMPQPIRRRFTLADAMILIAAAAVGIAAARWWHQITEQEPPTFQKKYFLLNGEIIPIYLSWFFLPFTPAMIAIRLRKPRPTYRRLFWQPGIQVSTAVGCAVVCPVLEWGSIALIPTDAFAHHFPFYAIGNGLTTMVGPMVAVSWLIAFLVGRRRSEAGWIDRGGRVLGWVWISLWVAKMTAWIGFALANR